MFLECHKRSRVEGIHESPIRIEESGSRNKAAAGAPPRWLCEAWGGNPAQNQSHTGHRIRSREPAPCPPFR
jgi:hypothetical protein